MYYTCIYKCIYDTCIYKCLYNTCVKYMYLYLYIIYIYKHFCLSLSLALYVKCARMLTYADLCSLAQGLCTCAYADVC